jgi:metallo-beta-lactamase class B
MFGRLAIAALLLASCTPITKTTIIADTSAQGTALAKACEGRDGWSDPAPPARIFGNTYYVGTCGISVLLVTSPKGHVLIDGATAEAVPSILSNIRTLGFDPKEIRYLVGSHEHLDHMGGFAALKAATGAKLFVSLYAKTVVESGVTDKDDPQAGAIPNMTPVPVDGHLTSEPWPGMIITGEPTRILSLSPRSTPGHTSGGTSWTWQSCEKEKCVNFAYIDSMTAVSRDGYRFTDHPERIAPFRETFSNVESLPCDILVTPHPSFSSLFKRLSGAEPLVNPNACRNLVAAMRKRLDDRLAKEATN